VAKTIELQMVERKAPVGSLSASHFEGLRGLKKGEGKGAAEFNDQHFMKGSLGFSEKLSGDEITVASTRG